MAHNETPTFLQSKGNTMSYRVNSRKNIMFRIRYYIKNR